MQIQSTRFGEITVPEDSIVHFPEGLPGFDEEHDFAFLIPKSESPVAYMQAIHDKDLTFVLVDPFSFFNHYSFELDEQLMSQVEVTEDEPPEVFAIVKVPDNIEEMTVNLMAPLVINWKKHKAMQVVLSNSPYSFEQRLFPYGLPKIQRSNGQAAAVT